jgi:hypothetical protein
LREKSTIQRANLTGASTTWAGFHVFLAAISSEHGVEIIDLTLDSTWGLHFYKPV